MLWRTQASVKLLMGQYLALLGASKAMTAWRPLSRGSLHRRSLGLLHLIGDTSSCCSFHAGIMSAL